MEQAASKAATGTRAMIPAARRSVVLSFIRSFSRLVTDSCTAWETRRAGPDNRKCVQRPAVAGFVLSGPLPGVSTSWAGHIDRGGVPCGCHSVGGPGVPEVIAAQEGDRRALDDLLAGYLPLIYNIVGRALNGHADVDDVVQETMLRAVRGLAGLRDPAAFRSWLVAVAVRQVHDYHRARPRPRAATWPATSPIRRPTSSS